MGPDWLALSTTAAQGESMLSALDPMLIFAVCIAFLAAGAVKGVIGLGLPTVSLAIMVTMIDMKAAIALMLIPALATNIVQAARGGAFLILFSRLAPLLICASAGIWFGVSAWSELDGPFLTAFLGCILAIYASLGLLKRGLPPPGRWEKLLSPLVGAITGVINGMTGSFVVPGVLYLQALNLGKEALVQAMGITFTVTSAVFIATLALQGRFSVEIGALSLVGLIPAFVGMAFGARLRKRLNENLFKQVFFASLLLLGLYLIARTSF